MLDFEALRNGTKTLDDLVRDLGVSDLHALADEVVDTVLGLLEGAQDDEVVYEPEDPQAYDEFAATEVELRMPWTLGHVVVHLVASAEEGAAQSATLARGVAICGRSRYETPWQQVTTVAQLRSSLEACRRMLHAFLSAWPEPPHLGNTYTSDYPGAKPRNAVAYFVAGLAHADSHLGQIREIRRQASRVVFDQKPRKGVTP